MSIDARTVPPWNFLGFDLFIWLGYSLDLAKWPICDDRMHLLFTFDDGCNAIWSRPYTCLGRVPPDWSSVDTWKLKKSSCSTSEMAFFAWYFPCFPFQACTFLLREKLNTCVCHCCFVAMHLKVIVVWYRVNKRGLLYFMNEPVLCNPPWATRR